MSKFPFQLLIKRSSSKNKEESLLCTALLRAIPGRREVYDAQWNDKNVIVKVFSDKISSRRHLKREWQGLSKLTDLQLSSPKPLFYGKTKDGQFAMVVEKISDSTTVSEAFFKTAEPARKLDLLIPVCKELAKQHNKGVLQKDMHLGNFLLANDKVFLLDPGQMRFLRSEVGKKTSISRLAVLARHLRTGPAGAIEKLCQEYFDARGWHFGKADEELIQKQITMHRKRDIKIGLKKCLRTSKRYLKIENNGYVAVFDRDFCAGSEPLDFINKVDALMNEGRILKNGNTCYVSRLMWNGNDVAVKRYNHKGFIHSLRHTIKRSRARQSWLHSHRLRLLQIQTPKPLAYIEQYKQKLVWQSYLVNEYVEGQKLHDFLRDDKTDKEKRSSVTQQVTGILDKMAKYKITHGDLKHSNILIADNGPVITDLDGMKVHRSGWLFRIRRRSDIARLEKDGLF